VDHTISPNHSATLANQIILTAFLPLSMSRPERDLQVKPPVAIWQQELVSQS
jgi:hypothetical protein